MLDKLFANPLVQTAAVPAAVSFLVAGFLRLSGGRVRGTALTGAGIAFGLLATLLIVNDLPRFPPGNSNEKLAYLILGGMWLGGLLDALPWRRSAAAVGIVLAAAAAIFWFGLPASRLTALFTDAQPAMWLEPMALFACGVLVLTRLYVRGQFGGDAVVTLGVASLALAPIAFLGGSALYAQLAGALAAAVGGMFLWNWPRPRFPLGLAGVLGAGTACVALAVGLVRYAEAIAWPFLALLPIFFADAIANRLGFMREPRARWFQPFVVAGIALIPAIAAVVATYLMTAGDDSGGY